MIRTYLSLILAGTLMAQTAPLTPKSPAPDPNWDRLYPNAQILEMMRGYAKAYPDWVKLESLGKTSAGGDTWLMTITNPKTGAPGTKPALYIDGATHANEIQGTEVTMYTINFVLKNYGKLPRVTEFLDRATLYVVPMMNIDSRERWFTQPATPNFPRTLPVSIDDDRDGFKDEDGFDDLDGDGEITMMRKKVPLGQGRFKLDPKDPRLMVPVQANELGEYIMLGTEGIDNDGDGQVNEDTYGYIDPNRAWGEGWMPRYVQSGSSEYPLQYPEQRNIAQWFRGRTNINAVLSFHNFGRYILRGPGAKPQRAMGPADLRVHDFLGKEGEKILPGYRYGSSWQLLYDSYGDTTDHTYGRHGAISFVVELNGTQQDFNNDKNVSQEEQMKFNDELTQGRMFVPWKAYKHPQYGDIEVGGYKHDTNRSPEGFLNVEECHRNAMFILLNGHHLPMLKMQTPEVVKVKDGLYRIHVPVLNERMIPTTASIVAQHKLHRQDIATISGGKVIASGIVQDPFLNKVQMQEHRPERLVVNGGVAGYSTETLMFLVEARPGTVTFTYDSVKAGKINGTITLP
ncbi:MAG: peptidase M14 [Acidobacteria bacterium]|nr:peptidase M14 [Acidobacteriota bacterium]